MAVMHCELCNRRVAASRHIGVGTVILSVVTGGLWLFAIPFYDQRCPICRATALTQPVAGPRADRPSTESRLAELERRLGLTEGELEATSAELERLRAERDFYRQLLGDPSRRGAAGTDESG